MDSGELEQLVNSVFMNDMPFETICVTMSLQTMDSKDK